MRNKWLLKISFHNYWGAPVPGLYVEFYKVNKGIVLIHSEIIAEDGIKKIEKLQLFGDRNLVQIAAAKHSLRMLCEIFLQNF